MTITAIVNTRNAERHLEQVLARLRDFDEILVCDMESTDATVRIATEAGARVITFPATYNYVEPARDFALRAAKSDWALFVDADELVSPSLVRYLKQWVETAGDTGGLMIPRKNFFLDKWIRSNYPDYQLRMLRRDVSSWPTLVHARPIVNAPVESIPAQREELAYTHLAPPMTEVLDRLNRYTTAELRRNKRQSVSVWSLALYPFMAFCRCYVMRRAFRNGVAGFIQAVNEANYIFYTLAKQYESKL